LIYCSQCGSQVSAADLACHACGRALPTTLNLPQPSASEPRIAPIPDRFLHPYYGIGGWLTIFIFSIVFVGPVYHTLYFIQHYPDNMELIARSVHPYSLYLHYFVQTAARIAVYGYGVFAGIQLWRIRPNAVKHAKQFLIVLLLLPIADYLIGINWLTLMSSEQARGIALSNFLVGKTARAIVRSAIYSSVWYAYLFYSERVHIRYAEKS